MVTGNMFMVAKAIWQQVIPAVNHCLSLFTSRQQMFDSKRKTPERFSWAKTNKNTAVDFKDASLYIYTRKHT